MALSTSVTLFVHLLSYQSVILTEYFSVHDIWNTQLILTVFVTNITVHEFEHGFSDPR
jgi:hypothetical protein